MHSTSLASRQSLRRAVRPPCVRASAIPPHLKARFEQSNSDDRASDIADVMLSLSKWCRDHDAIADLHDRPHVLHELNYIRVMYKPPLTPSQRVRVRETISDLLEQEPGLSEAHVNFLVSILDRLGCL